MVPLNLRLVFLSFPKEKITDHSQSMARCHLKTDLRLTTSRLARTRNVRENENLKALKRVEEQERLHAYNVSRQQCESRGKKICLGSKRGKKGTRKFSNPMARKSLWPGQDIADLSDMETDWTDINKNRNCSL